EGGGTDRVLFDRLQVGILDGKEVPVGHDAERARRGIVESDLARPLHIEPAGGVLIVGVDLIEASLQVGDVIEIGVDALDGLVLRFADERRRRLRSFHRGFPACALVGGGRRYLGGRRRRAGRFLGGRRQDGVLRFGQAVGGTGHRGCAGWVRGGRVLGDGGAGLALRRGAVFSQGCD